MSAEFTVLTRAHLEDAGVDASIPVVLNGPAEALKTVAFHQSAHDLENQFAHFVPEEKAARLLTLRGHIHDIRQSLTKEQLNLTGTFGRKARAVYLAEHKIEWEDALPKDASDAERDKYIQFLDNLAPATDDDSTMSKTAVADTPRSRIDGHMAGLSSAVRERDYLAADPATMTEVRRLQAAQFITYHWAGVYRAALRREKVLIRHNAQIVARAQSESRELNPVEQQQAVRANERLEELRELQERSIKNEAVRTETIRRSLLDQARALERGLLVTESMQSVINRVLPGLKLGKPLFLMGETGGAKTALAKYISHEYFGADPEVLDGNPEMSVHTAIGRTGLRPSLHKDGVATESYFDAGPLYRAMAEGRPCIGDEIDNMPTSFLIGLNRILQLRPGDRYMPPGADEPIFIRPGFCFIATANMKSERYTRQKIDPSTLNRFRSGAGVEMIHYPDADQAMGDGTLTENTKLAVAALTDGKGNLCYPQGVSALKFTKFVAASHATQKLFADASAIATKSEYCPDSQLVTRASRNGEPVLKEAVMAPREMIGLLQYLNHTHGAVTLEKALASFIGTQQIPTDRLILTAIFAGHDLLTGITENELRVPEGTLSALRSSASGA